jgi:hydrogenase large subunit
MGQRIVVDPITRIEGHLRIEVEVENGVVTDAWSAGTMARGMEILLQDKDPRDAPYVTSRVCGVCQGVHAISSAFALDDAFDAEVPEAGRLLRNLFCSGMYMQDHFIHFYVLSALDYLDIMAIAEYKGNDAGLLAIKNKIVKLVQAGDTSPFTPRYTPAEYSEKDPETVTTLVSHYIQAVEMKAKNARMLALISGVQPHTNTINVGGCMATPSREDLLEFRRMFEEQVKWVNEVYIPDVIAVGTGPLLPLATMGLGGGHENYYCVPMFPQADSAGKADLPYGGRDHLFKGGIILGGALNAAQNVDNSKIMEDISHAWLDYPDNKTSLHPYDGVTDFNLDKNDAYSFMKAPRYDGNSMEVGPLARGLVNQYPELMNLVSQGAKPGAVARHFCRAIETKKVGEAGLAWIDRLIELATAGPLVTMNDKPIPKSSKGEGFWDAPRGALGHWIVIEDHRTKNYQMVVPSTWNASPRDSSNVRGQYEQALIGAPVPDVDNPINVVRIVRSFDPCIACAIHMIDPETNDIKVHKVV